MQGKYLNTCQSLSSFLDFECHERSSQHGWCWKWNSSMRERWRPKTHYHPLRKHHSTQSTRNDEFFMTINIHTLQSRSPSGVFKKKFGDHHISWACVLGWVHVRASGEGPRYFAKTEVLTMWLKWLYVVVITWRHMFRRRLGPYMALARGKIRSMLEKLKKVPKLKKIQIFFNFSFFVEFSHFS